MAFADVNPISALWLARGLTDLLLPESGALAARARLGGWGGVQPGGRPGQPVGGSQALPPRAAGGGRRPSRDGAPGGAAAQSEKAAVARREAPLPDGGRILPPSAWPEPWRLRLAATRPGAILWTYGLLGDDVCGVAGAGREERRDFLRRLLGDLGHKAGTHTFWPVRLPGCPPDGAPGSLSDADLFWSGVRALRARGVVVLGADAAAAAGLPAGVQPPSQLRHRGNLVWRLWDMPALMGAGPRYASMLAFLRQAFATILR